MPTATGRIVAADMEFKIHAHETTHTMQGRPPAEYVRSLREYFGPGIDGTLVA